MPVLSLLTRSLSRVLLPLSRVLLAQASPSTYLAPSADAVPLPHVVLPLSLTLLLVLLLVSVRARAPPTTCFARSSVSPVVSLSPSILPPPFSSHAALAEA